jgi:hypothetical protein
LHDSFINPREFQLSWGYGAGNNNNFTISLSQNQDKLLIKLETRYLSERSFTPKIGIFLVLSSFVISSTVTNTVETQAALLTERKRIYIKFCRLMKLPYRQLCQAKMGEALIPPPIFLSCF